MSDSIFRYVHISYHKLFFCCNLIFKIQISVSFFTSAERIRFVDSNKLSFRLRLNLQLHFSGGVSTALRGSLENSVSLPSRMVSVSWPTCQELQLIMELCNAGQETKSVRKVSLAVIISSQLESPIRHIRAQLSTLRITPSWLRAKKASMEVRYTKCKMLIINRSFFYQGREENISHFKWKFSIS